MSLVKLARAAVLVGASVAVATLWLLAGEASADWQWTPPPAIATSVVKATNVPVQMSDGTTLYVDIVRPADANGNPLPGRYPVLLTQTPYNKNTPSLNFEDDYLVEHGYVQVIADVRGTGSSEGTWNSFGTREQQDGYDLAEWTRSQPSSDGSIGLHGTSYGAINQFLTAEQQPPGVKAAFPIVPMSDAYRDVTFGGGETNTSFIPSWLGLVTAAGLLPPTYTPTDPAEAANVLVQHSGGALSFQGAQILDSTTGGSAAYDGPFYQERSPIDMISRDHVPTFIVGGWWFDLFQRGEPLLYQALARQGVPTRLLMGPWYHITAGNGLPAQGVPPLDQLELRWMDHYVKGIPDPSLNDPAASGYIPPVTYYENGAGRWTSADGWYASDVGFQALHLSGPAAPGSPGTLAPTGPPKSQSPDTLVYNPATGACSRSTIQWTAGAGGGAGTPCETDDRLNDATSLSYDLPITHDLRLLGPMAARLWVASQGGRDSMITARVEDVAPDGTATQMSAGWATISLRALDPSKTVYADELMTQPYHPYTQASVLPIPSDGSPVEVDVEIYPTGWDLPAGHTLRLTLQEADVPHLMAPLPTALNEVGATLSIYHDAAHDSELVIPVRGAAPATAPRILTPTRRTAARRHAARRPRHHRRHRRAKRHARRRRQR